MRDIHKEIPTTTLSNLTNGKSTEKAPKNHQKRKTGETQSSLEEPHRIIYTYHEGSYKV
jgi:hypothetical protein